MWRGRTFYKGLSTKIQATVAWTRKSNPRKPLKIPSATKSEPFKLVEAESSGRGEASNDYNDHSKIFNSTEAIRRRSGNNSLYVRGSIQGK